MSVAEAIDSSDTFSGLSQYMASKSSEPNILGNINNFFKKYQKLLGDIDERILLEQAVGENFFLSLISNAQSFDSILKITSQYFLKDIVDRLYELINAEIDFEVHDPISLDSVKLFLTYCWNKNINKRPFITATPEGIIQATWKDGSKKYFIRFYSRKNCIFFYKDKDQRKTLKLDLDKLPLNP